MTELNECSICGSENDDQTVHGFFGITPVAFCVWCQASLYDYCKQYGCEDCEE